MAPNKGTSQQKRYLSDNNGSQQPAAWRVQSFSLYQLAARCDGRSDQFDRFSGPEPRCQERLTVYTTAKRTESVAGTSEPARVCRARRTEQRLHGTIIRLGMLYRSIAAFDRYACEHSAVIQAAEHRPRVCMLQSLDHVYMNR